MSIRSPEEGILSEFYHLRRTAIKDVAAYIGFLLGFIGAAPFAWGRLAPQLESDEFVRGLWYFFGFVGAAGVVAGVAGLAVGIGIGSVWERYHRSRRASIPESAPASPGPVLTVHEAMAGTQAFAPPQTLKPEIGIRSSPPSDGPRLQLIPPTPKTEAAPSPLLLLLAAFGFLVPNGFFVIWMIREYEGFGAIFSNHLAMGFILDAFLATVILTVYFARRPIGPVRWPIFAILSLLGGLGFSLPLYCWLNRRRSV